MSELNKIMPQIYYIIACFVLSILMLVYSRIDRNATREGLIVPEYILWEVIKGIKIFIVFVFTLIKNIIVFIFTFVINTIVFIFGKLSSILFGTSDLVFKKTLSFTWNTSVGIAKKTLETYEKSQDRSLELKRIRSQEKIAQQKFQEEEKRRLQREQNQREKENRFLQEKINSEILNLVSLRINQDIDDRQFRQQLNILKAKYPTANVEETIKRVLI